MPPFFAEQRGLTLAEVLPAIAILSIGLVALVSALPLVGSTVREGGHLSTATFLATQRLEQLRTAPWATSPDVDRLGVSPLPSQPPVSGEGTTFLDETPLPAPYGAFNRTVRVSDCGTPAGCQGVASPDLRQVTVTVTYTPMSGTGAMSAGTKGAVLTTLASRR